ncbi:MAG: hypothetical protein GX610_22265 [Rhodococcus sp.]|nr:hypothetical protein [Rhodococcus sp. (in: high G+C Gram-positive bacteria)]
MRSAVFKAVIWTLFAIGLIGAGLGIAELHVEWIVASLIVASVSGLVLLRIRADAHPEMEMGIDLERPARRVSAG